MPYSKEHKQLSRIKILDSAFTLFTKKGFETTSIDEIMEGAQMTRGAFYAHFESKSELYHEALIHAAEKSKQRYQKPQKVSEEGWLKVLLRSYLHKDHVQQKTSACPLAFLVTDVAVREPTVQKAYTNAFKELTDIVAGFAEKNAKKDTVLAATTMLIGAIAVARAVNDTKLTERLLRSCKKEVNQLLSAS